MNTVVLVGRLVGNPEIVTTESNKKLTTIVLAVHRNYKNSDGIYETDFVRCTLWNGVAASTCEYCHAGDIIGVKGRLETRSYEKDDKQKKFVTEVIADKITFLSSVKSKDETKKEN